MSREYHIEDGYIVRTTRQREFDPEHWETIETVGWLTKETMVDQFGNSSIYSSFTREEAIAAVDRSSTLPENYRISAERIRDGQVIYQRLPRRD